MELHGGMNCSDADNRTVKALARLQFNEEFKTYTKFLESSLDTLRRKNDTLTGELLKWNQGKCQALQIILDHPCVASKILKNSP
ncbi:hypothetical protein [Desulfobacula sp.]|uniref:hypothetical protein n=1 Tax=Desulfobacula sp. TaxID=2593537 RepID=UPI00262BD1EF|nr:hypothetical protein [Desulfobacula sp.]